MTKAPKTDTVDPTRQVVDCGAAVRLDDAVLEHGIIFVHPELPLFKLYVSVDVANKKIDKYHFELCKPRDERVKQFIVQIREVGDEAKIIMPDKGLVG